MTQFFWTLAEKREIVEFSKKIFSNIYYCHESATKKTGRGQKTMKRNMNINLKGVHLPNT